MCVCLCSVVFDSATPWTIAHQAPLFMEFSRQEYWSGLPFPPGDLPDPGIEPMSLVSPALAGGFFTTEPPGKCLKDGSKGRCQDRGRGRKRSIFSNSGIFLHSLMDAYFFLSCYYHRDLSTSTDPMHKAVTANILLERYQKPSIPACCPLQACSPFPGGSFWGCAQSLKSCPTLWAPIQYSCLENPMDGGAW